ncbi:Carboxyl-terminal-processing peptidase 3 chloroplastic [Bienertia sinuspersici]
MASISMNHNYTYKILPKPTSNSTFFSPFSPHSSIKLTKCNPKYRVSVLCSLSSDSRNCLNIDSRNSLSSNSQKLLEFRSEIGKWAFNFAAGTIAVASIFLDFNSPAFADSLTVAFPVSRSIEVNRVQRTLVEAWGLIRETFIDPTFNQQDWDSKLQQTMVEIFPLKSADAAYNKISGMVSSLGDPFTRIVNPKVVVSCVEDSPAARAGIHEGDELVEINGDRLDGMSSETVAQKLRGRAGTTVKGKDTPFNSNLREVNLPREYIKLSPISSTIIPHKTPDGNMSRTGYVKLSVFSQTAASDMEKVINQLEEQGVHSFILDLRNNPVSTSIAQGGLVQAGLDVAQLWLDGEETLVYTTDRDRHIFPINMVDGHAITHDPLVILSVTELHDGSALFVTVAKYLSPLRHEIDKVGIAPDVQCTADMLSTPKASAVKDKKAGSILEADSCIMVAEHELDVQQSEGTAS